MNTPATSAIIYTRVSRDNAKGRSVAEQEAECRAVCEREGWPVAEVICDNDRSASRYARKDRPGFDRLREIVAPGHAIVCWEASRLSRDLGALIGLRDLCIERGVAMSYGGQLVDLDEPKFVIDGMMSEQEAKKTRERILRAHRANLAEGKPHGRVPYGYKIVRDPETGKSTGRTPDPDRAPLVQEAARRVLAGQSFGSVVRWIETKDPIGWDSAKLRRILLNATYAGYRTVSATIDGKRGPQEIHGKGTWEPILTDEQHHDLVALFAGRKTGPRGVPVKHLLTGIARCAVCGEHVWKARGGRRKDGTGYVVYQCKEHCVGRNMEATDGVVLAVVEGILTTPESLAALAEVPASDPTAPARLAELRQRLEDVENEIAEGRMPPSTGARVATRLEAQIADAEADATPVFTDPLIRDLATAPDPMAMWQELPLVAKREFIRSTMTITIDRVGRGRWHKPSDAITITPRRPAVAQ
ncbi:recombinase family protein [Gordonia sp. SL306]|uniref:recombinase family protein n=1 Tax=Gordonia sp. SL306 TaxID=2995145 RepID=UPI00226F272C|nr:recombinase family protein [Gordonia sp. SL306]WAC55175.1 recombinase family protein [Gordonia sp. SL306]